MAICKECGNDEYEGALFCSECGASLLELGGEVAVLEQAPDPDPPPLIGQQVGTAETYEKLTFMVPLSGRKIDLEARHEIRVGRSVPGHDDPPELDTTPDNGAEYGVSRNHAVIKISEQGIVLVDLNSTNGTMLNNYRLPPELPYPIKSGDEISFGSLLMHVFLH
jgi:Icc-related predicted phosphoesterase